VHDHHEPRLLAAATLHDAANGDPCLAEDVGDGRQDPGAVGDLEVKVEGRGHVAHHRQFALGVVDRSVAGEDRDDVAKHGGRRCHAAGAGSGDRDLVDRRGLHHDGVERALDGR
jgi:hypothetical protein